MIGFSPPNWFTVDGEFLACFTITDDPGGQYIYRNCSPAWIENYLHTLKHGGCYVSSSNGGSPDSIPGELISCKEIVIWWKAKKASGMVFPSDSGISFTFTATDRRTIFMIYGSDKTPERAWKANPTRIALHYGGVPHKTRKQRKLEQKDPTMKKEWPSWRTHKHPDQNSVKEQLPQYIYGKSLYEPRTFEDE